MNMLLREGRSHVREFVEVPGGFRRSVEDAIEGLLAVLDQLDGDPDLEDDGSAEPTLGWPQQFGSAQIITAGRQDDGELEDGSDSEEDKTGSQSLRLWLQGSATGEDDKTNSSGQLGHLNGFARAANDNGEVLQLREQLAPHLGFRWRRRASSFPKRET